MTEQQILISEFCEREEAKLESEAMDEYRREHYPSSGGKHSEITLSENVIKETQKGA